VAAAAEQLAAALGGFNDSSSRFYTNWVGEMTAEAQRAIAEGDLREDLDPEVVSRAVVGTMFGARLLANAISRRDVNQDPVSDLTTRLSRLWELLLPGIASEGSLSYLRQFLAREVLRHAHPDVARSGTDAAPDGG
jgi:hypothetical protein